LGGKKKAKPISKVKCVKKGVAGGNKQKRKKPTAVIAPRREGEKGEQDQKLKGHYFKGQTKEQNVLAIGKGAKTVELGNCKTIRLRKKCLKKAARERDMTVDKKRSSQGQGERKRV